MSSSVTSVAVTTTPFVIGALGVALMRKPRTVLPGPVASIAVQLCAPVGAISTTLPDFDARSSTPSGSVSDSAYSPGSTWTTSPLRAPASAAPIVANVDGSVPPTVSTRSGGTSTVGSGTLSPTGTSNPRMTPATNATA